MPRLSSKQLLERDLWTLWIHEVSIHGALAPSALHHLCLYEGIQEQRYQIPRSLVPKSNWITAILPQYNDDRWRSFTRMDPQSFIHVLRLIQNSPIFQNNSNRPQASISSQLKIALYKLAQNGSGSGFRPSSTQWGVSEGHIYNSTRRVVYALFQLRNRYIKWPFPEVRHHESFKNYDRAGFVGAVGSLDGTDIVLENKPGGEYQGEQFFNRKKRYALDLCAVCNSDLTFTYTLTGFSNATHDSRVFSSTQLYYHPEEYFSPGQYLLADSAYSATRYLTPPYKAPAANKAENRSFNKLLSSCRVDIEHAFGVLKGRWRSLTGLRIRITNKAQYEYACMWITACVVLHNILLEVRDEWREDEGWWTREEQEEHDEGLQQLLNPEHHTGQQKREEVKRTVLEMNGWRQHGGQWTRQR